MTVPGGAHDWLCTKGGERAVAFLVDDHPLDTYLAASAMLPSAVHLLHAPHMVDVAGRIGDALAAELGCQVELREVADHSSVSEVRAAIRALPEGVHLHHTGGTGALNTHARMAMNERGAADVQCSFFDEERRILRRDDGVDVPLSEAVDRSCVSVDVLCKLFGLNRLPDVHGQAEEETDLVRQAVQRVDLAFGLGTSLSDYLRESILEALTDLRPRKGRLSNDAAWRRFSGGIWLERLVAAACEAADPGCEIASGVGLERGEGRMEIDVLVVGQYRPFVISCGSSSKGLVARDKLFEVMVRTEQIGGPAGRPGVVALLDHKSSPRGEFLIEGVRSNDGPVATCDPRLFTASDVASWIRAMQSDEDDASLDGLRSWLAS